MSSLSERMVKTMEKIKVCPVCGFVGYAEDAVEMVRCKDCKHYSVKGKTTQFGFCGYRHAGTDETDYCSRAVRRKE